MRKLAKILGLFVLSIGLLAGCGEDTGNNESGGEKVEEKKPEFTENEKLAKEFVNVMYNVKNKEEAEKFMKENVHKDVMDLLMFGAGNPEDKNALKEITPIGSSEFQEDGEEAEVVKLDAVNTEDKTITIYVMFMENKIGWLVREDRATKKEGKEMFNQFEKAFNKGQ